MRGLALLAANNKVKTAILAACAIQTSERSVEVQVAPRAFFVAVAMVHK